MFETTIQLLISDQLHCILHNHLYLPTQPIAQGHLTYPLCVYPSGHFSLTSRCFCHYNRITWIACSIRIQHYNNYHSDRYNKKYCFHYCTDGQVCCRNASTPAIQVVCNTFQYLRTIILSIPHITHVNTKFTSVCPSFVVCNGC